MPPIYNESGGGIEGGFICIRNFINNIIFLSIYLVAILPLSLPHEIIVFATIHALHINMK